MMLRKICLSAVNRTVLQSSSNTPLVGPEFIEKSIFSQRNTPRLLACSLHLSSPQYAKKKQDADLWQTQKQRKAVRDQSTAIIHSKLELQLRTVLYKDRDFNPNPKTNSDLAKVVKKSQAIKIPSDIINSAIDYQVMIKEQLPHLTSFTARGGNNSGLVVVCFAPKVKHAENIIQGYIKKSNFSVYKPADDLFRHAGLVDVAVPEAELAVAKSEPSKFDLDKYVDIAIEYGAEDVSLVSDIPLPYLQFECDPNLVDSVHQALDEAGQVVISAEVTYLPTFTVPMDNEFLGIFAKTEEVLKKKMEGFVSMHCNVEPEES